MSRIYANLDQIVNIKLYYEELTEYVFYPATEDVYKTYFWGLYKELVVSANPNRWSKKERYGYLTEEEVKEWKEHYRVDENLKRLYKNPRVVITYTNKESTTVYFKTDDELNKYVANLQNKFDLNLILIK